MIELYSLPKIYTSDIHGWYYFEQTDIIPLDRYKYDYLYNEFNRISISNIFHDYTLMKVDTYVVEMNLFDRINAYDDILSSFKKQRVELRKLVCSSSINISLECKPFMLDNIIEILKKEIQEEGWTDLFIMQDFLDIDISLILRKRWRELSHYNKLGKVGEHIDEKYLLYFSLYIGGYKKEKELVYW